MMMGCCTRVKNIAVTATAEGVKFEETERGGRDPLKPGLATASAAPDNTRRATIVLKSCAPPCARRNTPQRKICTSAWQWGSIHVRGEVLGDREFGHQQVTRQSPDQPSTVVHQSWVMERRGRSSHVEDGRQGRVLRLFELQILLDTKDGGIRKGSTYTSAKTHQ